MSDLPLHAQPQHRAELARILREELGAPLLTERGEVPDIPRHVDAVALTQLALTLPISALATLTLADRLGLTDALARVQARLAGRGITIELPEGDTLLLEHAPIADLLAAAEASPHPEPVWDVFLAHASADLEPVVRLHDALSAAGCRVFRDRTGLAPGQDWTFDLLNAQRCSRVTIAVISPSWRDAPYLRDELVRALDLRRHHAHDLLPVYLEGIPQVQDIPSGLAVLAAVDAASFGSLEAAAAVVAARVLRLREGT